MEFCPVRTLSSVRRIHWCMGFSAVSRRTCTITVIGRPLVVDHSTSYSSHRSIASYSPRICIRLVDTPVIPVGILAWRLVRKKTRMVWQYPMAKKIRGYVYSFWQNSRTWLTDRQTDTAWLEERIGVASIASCEKNIFQIFAGWPQGKATQGKHK